MPTITPVDHDPFAPAPSAAAAQFIPVDHDPFPHPTLLQRAADLVTGNLRQTPETQALPDIGNIPFPASFAGLKAGIGTLFANPQETAQVLQANGIISGARPDEKGNLIVTSAIDGKEYAIKPGFQPSDIPKAAGAVAAFSPAAKAGSLIGMMGGAGLTQTGIEASQAATGGEFNPGDIAAATALAGVVPPIAKGISAAVGAARSAVGRVLGTAAEGAPAAAPEVAAAAKAAQPEVSPAAAPQAAPQAPAAPAPPVTPLSSAELGQTAKAAAQGSKKAKDVLAQQASPDPELLASAERLGIKDYLQPDHVTTNQAFRELAQAVKSVPGSEARASEIQGLQAVGERADRLVNELGGSGDISSVSANVRGELEATQQRLASEADRLYGEVRAKLPPQAPASADSTLAFIKQRAEELGGAENLTPAEKLILRKLTPKTIKTTQTVPGNPLIPGQQSATKQAGQVIKPPTYAVLDDVRKDLGAAASRAGPFKDADSGLAKKLYSLLSDDQAKVANQYGIGDTFGAAKAAVQLRKGIEDDLTSLFGRALDRDFTGALSNSVGSLAKGDASQLVRLISSVPKNLRQQVTASGLQTAFGKSTQNGTLNFNTFTRWYEGLQENKQAASALFSNLPPEARQSLADLYKVSKGITLATRERITTGRIQAVKDELQSADGLMANIYNIAKRSAAGAAAEAVTTPLGMPGAGLSAGIASALTKGKPNVLKAADELIASPEFVEATRSAGTQNQAKAVRRLAYSRPFDRFARSLGNTRELSNRERWILRSLEANNQR